MDCDEFMVEGGHPNETQANYTWTYNSTKPESSPDVYCYTVDDTYYYDWLTYAVRDNCYNYATYESWCAYNVSAIHGDNITFFDC